MNQNKKTARIAGVLYFAFLVVGIFSFFYVPSKIFVDGNATLTTNNILANELLFRFGIASNLIGQIIFIFLALTLYQLFKEVNKTYAKIMVALVIAPVPVTFLVILNQVTSLILLSGADFLKVFNQNQLQALSMLFYNLYNYGIIVVGIFWGLWLYPFGYLVFKSGFIPKIFGVLLILGCFGFLADSFLFLLAPDFRATISDLIAIPATIAELSMISWLLIKGVKD
ncbi:MAG: DUF4386 domain-containing protein [Candidatus Moraniibacteriota bacterium]